MLTPRRRKEKPVQARKKRTRVVEPKLIFEETESGIAVIRINNSDAYMSFGKEECVKWVAIHYENGYGSVTKLYPVALLSIPAPATKAIGKKNIARVRELVRERIDKDGRLPRKKLMKMGKIINKENE